MAVYHITIDGPPKAQKRHKFGKGYVYDPSKKDKQQIIPIVQRYINAPNDVDGMAFKNSVPVHISFAFYMPIPKSWSKKKKLLLDDETTHHTSTPDIDNMIKLYMDVLPFNDKQVSVIRGAFKVYSPRPRVELVLRIPAQ